MQSHLLSFCDACFPFCDAALLGNINAVTYWILGFLTHISAYLYTTERILLTSSKDFHVTLLGFSIPITFLMFSLFASTSAFYGTVDALCSYLYAI